MQDKSIDPSVETSESNQQVRRILQQRKTDLLLALLCRPLRTAEIVGWRLLGKKLRARSKLERTIAGLPFALRRWINEDGEQDLRALGELGKLSSLPRLAVHVHVSAKASRREVRSSVRSALIQSTKADLIVVSKEPKVSLPAFDSDQIVVLPEPILSQLEGFKQALLEVADRRVEWLVPLDAQSRLPRHSISGYKAHLARQRGTKQLAILYGDEGDLSPIKPVPRLWLKPEWDDRMILSQDFISQACAVNVAKAFEELDRKEPSSLGSIFELVLRFRKTDQVEHVSRVTALTPVNFWQENGSNNAAAVAKALKGEAHEVSPGPFGTVTVKIVEPNPLPKVSAIVATRDRVELLRTCVEGVLNETDYPNLEVVIADNESVEPETLRYMEEVALDPRVKVVRWPHPFNYSAINNFAVQHSTGEYLCLLNNDIEVLESHWLRAMVSEVVQPDVGAVGARLLYPDHSIQHAGVVIGMGNAAGHAHRGLEERQPGYFAQALVARGASAVTAACLVVSREHFDAVGGLDEDKLAVAYNDVDFCLKLRERGLANIYTPQATLIHHESKSRGLDFAPEQLKRYLRELEVFQRRWDTTKVIDPWHHPKLDRSSEVYR